MCESTDVDVEALLEVVESVRGMVANFYGPQCAQTLLTSSTGKAVVTSDGFTILQALQPVHPVARLVTKAIDGCHAHTMDGCKVFLLYLSSILRTIDREAKTGRFGFSGMNHRVGCVTQKRHRVVRCARSIQSFIDDSLPVLFHTVAVCSEQLLKSGKYNLTLEDKIRMVCSTTLAPHFNPAMCQHFTTAILSLLPMNESAGTLCQSLRFLMVKFLMLTIKVPSRPYGDSTCSAPLLLRRDFALRCGDLVGGVRLLIMHGKVDTHGGDDDDDDDIKETLLVKQENIIQVKILVKRKFVSEFAQQCQRHNVNILLCSEGIPAYALDIFRYHKVSVISNVLKEDLELLELLAGKMALVTARDEPGEINIVSLDGVVTVTIGGQVYTHLKIKSSKVKQLIVCAPTVGLCDQVTVACQKSTNSMLQCFSNSCKNTNRYMISDDSEEISVNSSFENGKQAQDEIYSNKSEQETHGIPPKICSTELENDRFIETENVNIATGDTSYSGNVNSLKSQLKTCAISQDDQHDQYASTDKEKETPVTDITSKLDVARKCDDHEENKQMENVSHSERTLIIPGGGSFEVLLSHILVEHKNKYNDDNQSAVCDILSESLMYVVNVLHANTTEHDRATHRHRDYLHVKTVLEEKFCRDGVLWGVGRRGVPCDLGQKGVFEPLRSKLHILQCVLELVVQLLKVDKIVSVGKLNNTVSDD